MKKLQLPDAPASLKGPVKAWSAPVMIPTYLPQTPDKNPMFLDRRVYQGSTGKVYPLPFIDRIAEQKVDREWQAIHLENEFLRLMILPQIGGRIHVAMDKTNGYDFIYRQDVIKPALVGLAGPWISGGIEFNWPQHHRPATFMPCDVHIEEHDDGSRTVWMSDYDPICRMKGMHGVCLRPGRSFIELKARLYNRTSFTQTFLWWANVATRVHEKYQSFFPEDVSYVADHAKRAMSRFPKCDGHYYGVDYAARGRAGVPASEKPRQFIPPAEMYSPDDLSWYANIPVPTSYMCMGTADDFFGGYDHAAGSGIVHVASHHQSPGKKQWTWGNHEFGYAWDRNLTDPDEAGVYHPYIELMAGVFTDNQPDFSFLAPGETRTFTQYWYPIRQIGAAQQANMHAAVSLRFDGREARIGVAATASHERATIRLRARSTTIAAWAVELSPESPALRTLTLPDGVEPRDVVLTVEDGSGAELIRYQPREATPKPVPPAATEPPAPEHVAGVDELYMTGLHLEQYRHATRRPEAYWLEAIKRDPLDSRCNIAMGLWHLRRGEFEAAEPRFRKAIERLTLRNPNPADGSAHYYLGVTLRYLRRFDEAYDAFQKSAWNAAWQAPTFHAIAEIDCRRSDWASALRHLDLALRRDSDHLKARDLKAIVLKRLGQGAKATQLLRETLALDPLDWFARYLAGQPLECDTQVRLDLALDLDRAGLTQEAIALLEPANPEPHSGTAPLVRYYSSFFGKPKTAPASDPDFCFPARLEEIAILQRAIADDPQDSLAPYLLGNLLYDRGRRPEAIELWETSARINPDFATVWRNLGIGYFNVLNAPAQAQQAYDRAVKADPGDARLLYERDQLRKRLGDPVRGRLVDLACRIDLVTRRDDLSVEYCSLLNQSGQHEQALDWLTSRRFQPWEGGEGLALGQHVRTHLALGRQALRTDPKAARRHFEAALESPEHLGEARHLLASPSDVHYWLGIACHACGDNPAAARHWKAAAEFRGDFQDMSVRAFSELTYYSALSLRALGRTDEADQLLRDLLEYALQQAVAEAKIDYFATSLPSLLLFEDDLQHRQHREARLLEAQARLGLGERANATALLMGILAEDPSHARAADLLGDLA